MAAQKAEYRTIKSLFNCRTGYLNWGCRGQVTVTFGNNVKCNSYTLGPACVTKDLLLGALLGTLQLWTVQKLFRLVPFLDFLTIEKKVSY